MPQQDPAYKVLAPLQVSDDLKAEAWDTFHQAKDQNEFETRLKRLRLPDNAKADLWDLKYGAPQTAPITPAVPNTPTATIGPAPVSLLERARRSVVNTAVGHALEQTFPGLPDVLRPTETVASPSYEAHMGQVLAPETLVDPGTVTHGVLRGVGGLTSGPNLALIAATGASGGLIRGIAGKTAEHVFGRLVAAGFGKEMIQGLYHQSKRLQEQIDSGDEEGAKETLGEMGVSTLFTAMLTKHATTGEPLPTNPRWTKAGELEHELNRIDSLRERYQSFTPPFPGLTNTEMGRIRKVTEEEVAAAQARRGSGAEPLVPKMEQKQNIVAQGPNINRVAPTPPEANLPGPIPQRAKPKPVSSPEFQKLVDELMTDLKKKPVQGEPALDAAMRGASGEVPTPLTNQIPETERASAKIAETARTKANRVDTRAEAKQNLETQPAVVAAAPALDPLIQVRKNKIAKLEQQLDATDQPHEVDALLGIIDHEKGKLAEELKTGKPIVEGEVRELKPSVEKILTQEERLRLNRETTSEDAALAAERAKQTRERGRAVVDKLRGRVASIDAKLKRHDQAVAKGGGQYQLADNQVVFLKAERERALRELNQDLHEQARANLKDQLSKEVVDTGTNAVRAGRPPRGSARKGSLPVVQPPGPTPQAPKLEEGFMKRDAGSGAPSTC